MLLMWGGPAAAVVICLIYAAGLVDLAIWLLATLVFGPLLFLIVAVLHALYTGK